MVGFGRYILNHANLYIDVRTILLVALDLPHEAIPILAQLAKIIPIFLSLTVNIVRTRPAS